MDVLFYFFVGLAAAIFGALPLGTTNVAVINTTIKESASNAFKIIYTAALAELVLIVCAITFNIQIEGFINMNIWLQYAIVVVLLVVGAILISGRADCVKDENGECVIIKKKQLRITKQMLGFFLGLINPTVLIYWIFVISYLNTNIIELNMGLNIYLLLLFLAGAYLGKLMVLYAYGKFSGVLKVKMKNLTTRVNIVIGVLLLCISIVQITKLIYL